MKARSLLPSVRFHRPGLDVLTVVSVSLLLVQVVVAVGGGPLIGAEGELQQLRPVFQELGLSRPGILGGKVWEFVTHAFLHGGWIHWLLNWLVIVLVGSRIHLILGGRGFARIFFGGVLLGSVFHLLLQPALPLGGLAGELPNVPLVGASGGAMALLLALTGLSPDSRMWPLHVSGRNLGRGLLLASLILFAITPGVGIPGLSGIGEMLVRDAGLAPLFSYGHIYHFGGGLMGMLYARHLLRSPVSLEKLRKARARREGVVA